MTIETAVDYYVRDSMNKIPDSRKELVREKMLANQWIPYEEQKAPSDTRILTKNKEGKDSPMTAKELYINKYNNK